MKEQVIAISKGHVSDADIEDVKAKRCRSFEGIQSQLTAGVSSSVALLL